MIDISKIREGDEVLVRAKVDSVHPTIGDGRLRVQVGEFGERFSVDADVIAGHVPVFRIDDLVITEDYPPDVPAAKVLMCDGDYVVVRFPDMDAPQVLLAMSLVRVDPAAAIQAAAE